MTSRFKPTAISVTLLFTLAAAENCYFPNGGVAPDSSPCFPSRSSGTASVCCPLNWECLSNGLCFNDAEGFYQRSSCTDRTWSSSTCPGYCTQNNTAIGNEAVQQCSDGSWCCDKNRDPKWMCCDEDDAEVISVPDGKQVAFVSDAPSTTSVPDMTSRSSASASSSSSSTSASSSMAESSTTSTSTSETPVPTTITTRAATTNSAGLATTVTLVQTSAYTPTPAPTAASQEQQEHDHTPLIAGLAAGIPLGLALFGLLIFCIYRRRKNQQQDNPPTSSSSTDPSNLKYMYSNATPTGSPPEIDSYPVAAGTKPGHTSYVSELSGSSLQQQHSSPAISSLHSPQSGQTGFGILPQVQEEKREQEPVELSGESMHPAKRASYPGYVPYGGGQEGGAGRATSQQYVAYRPSDGGPPVSPMSPRQDVDHGSLGGGGLRIVNP